MSNSVNHLFHYKNAKKHKLTALKLAIPKFFKGIKEFNEPHIGTYVKLRDGSKFFVNNANKYRCIDGIQHKYYDLVSCDESRTSIESEKSEFYVVKTPKNLWWNATSYYRWWLHNWVDIDIRREINR